MQYAAVYCIWELQYKCRNARSFPVAMLEVTDSCRLLPYRRGQDTQRTDMLALYVLDGVESLSEQG